MNRRPDRTARGDRAIADALRAAGSEPPFEGSLDRLAARIDVAATPLLAARRQSLGRPMSWWEFAAGWARTVVPVGLTIAAASVVLLWMMRPVAPITAEAAEVHSSASILAAVGRGVPAPEAVDRAVDELVSPTLRSTSPRVPR